MIGMASRWLFALQLIFLIAALAADPQSTWVFDSITPKSSPSDTSAEPTDEEQVYAVILAQIRYWNAHDIEHYMDTYWNSRDLLVVSDARQVMGWAELLAAYKRGYPSLSEMGTATLQRVKLQRLSQEFFLSLTWYAVRLNGKDSYATDTMIFRKFPEGWKIINAHSSFLEP
jgi:ketosteroid isomerase-like protein